MTQNADNEERSVFKIFFLQKKRTFFVNRAEINLASGKARFARGLRQKARRPRRSMQRVT